MPDIGGLQLLPETRKKIEVRIPGQNRPIVLGVTFAIFILAVYLGLMLYNKSILSSIAGIDGQLSALENSRDKKLEQKLLGLKEQLAVVGPLIGSHLFWSQGFAKIQGLIQPQVQILSVTADSMSQKIVFKAVAANYTTIAKQIASFYTDDSITDIVLNKASGMPTGRIEFSMQLIFNPNKFLKKLK